MAQTSEFTILRTGGLGPGRALSLLATLGLAGAVLIAAVGNWLQPASERALSLHRAQFGDRVSLKLARGGTWLRERREVNGQVHNITVNVGAAANEGEFGLVRIFEFDAQGRLHRRLSAKEAMVQAIGDANSGKGSVWHLKDVVDTQWRSHDLLNEAAVLQGTQVIDEQRRASLDWQSSLTPLVVSASVLPPDTMSAPALWRYTQHLANNAQAAQRYEIEFWKKTFYPLVCLVMVALALPFAYLHARSGSMSLKIFGGIMLGISFVLINHISSHLGLLHQWQPWLAASVPSLLYLLLSLAAFLWLVRYR
jgi:lipopolysaccharide export system permease protein